MSYKRCSHPLGVRWHTDTDAYVHTYTTLSCQSFIEEVGCCVGRLSHMLFCIPCVKERVCKCVCVCLLRTRGTHAYICAHTKSKQSQNRAILKSHIHPCVQFQSTNTQRSGDRETQVKDGEKLKETKEDWKIEVKNQGQTERFRQAKVRYVLQKIMCDGDEATGESVSLSREESETRKKKKSRNRES